MSRHMLLTLVSFLIAASPASAALILPDGTGDFPTLQAAIDSVPVNGTGVFELGDGVFSGEGNRELNGDRRTVEFRSISNDPTLCQIDPDGYAMNDLTQFTTFTFEGVGFPNLGPINGLFSDWRFQGCVLSFVSGRFFCSYGYGTFRDCDFTGCLVPPLYRGEFGEVIMEDCRFVENFTTFGSPGIEFTRCVFRDNVVTNGALFEHVFIEQNMDNGEFGFQDCRFERNRADAIIRGISMPDNSSAYGFFVHDCVFWNNEGTVIDLVDFEPNITRCTFFGNHGAGSADVSLTCESCLSGDSDLSQNIHAFREEGSVVSVGPGVALPELWYSDLYDTNVGDAIPWRCIEDAPLFCNSTFGDFQLAVDSPCLAENNEWGLAMGALPEGCGESASVFPAGERTASARLLRPLNPFRPGTNLGFVLEEPGAVRLTVHDLNGRCVARLVTGETMEAGTHLVEWDGRGNDDQRLARGVLLLVLDVDGLHEAVKLTLLP